MVANVLVVVAIAGAMDAAIRALGWSQPRGELWPDFAPRGATIGAIWVGLFAGMGAARYLVARSASPTRDRDATAIVVLIVACLAYPIYTHVVRGHLTELIGNVASFALAATIAVRVSRYSPIAAAAIGLVSLWIVFATILVFALVALNGWATA